MVYNGKELYLSSVVYNEKNAIIFLSDILCTMNGEHVVHDEINDCDYPVVDFTQYKSAGQGKTYVLGVHPITAKKCVGKNIETYEELIEVAKQHNHAWTRILIPSKETLENETPNSMLVKK